MLAIQYFLTHVASFYKSDVKGSYQRNNKLQDRGFPPSKSISRAGRQGHGEGQ